MSSKITIARALRQVKKLSGNVAALRARLQHSTSWVEGKEPEFPFNVVLAEHDTAVAELIRLKTGIALTNAATVAEHRGRRMTLCEVILCMGELKGRVGLMAGLHLVYGEEKVRIDIVERKAVYETVVRKAVMTEPERVAKLDELRKEIDELNDLLEETNHRTAVVNV